MSNTHGTPDPELARRRSMAEVFQLMTLSGGIPTFTGATLTTNPFATAGYVSTGGGDELVYVSQPAAAIGPLNQGAGIYWLGLHRDIHTDVSPWVRQPSTHYVWAITGKSELDPAPMPIDGLSIFASLDVTGSQITAVFQPFPAATRFGAVGVHPNPSNKVAMQIAGEGRIVWTNTPNGGIPEGDPIGTIESVGNFFTVAATGTNQGANLTLDTRGTMRLQRNGTVLITLSVGDFVVMALPTTAPATSGALWRDASDGNRVKQVP